MIHIFNAIAITNGIKASSNTVPKDLYFKINLLLKGKGNLLTKEETSFVKQFIENSTKDVIDMIDTLSISPQP